MISSVRRLFRCGSIYASDLLFLRKKSLVVPIHQNCLLLLSTMKKPADQPLHVSTSVENLKYKCETAAMSTVMKKKNITGVYLAARWAVPNVVYQRLNALALTPHPTLSIMTLNLSPGKAGYVSLPSIWDIIPPSIWHSHTEVVNNSKINIALSIKQPINTEVCLEAGHKQDIKKKLFREGKTVIIRAGSETGSIVPQDFINYKKFVFDIDANGKLVWTRISYNGQSKDFHSL